MDNWGDCGRTQSRDGMEVDSGSKAFAEDKESYSAVLKTRFDFSCSQFEVIPGLKYP